LTDEDAAARGKPATAADAHAPKRKRRRGRAACLAGFFLGMGGLAGGRRAAIRIEFDVFNQFAAQFALVAAAFLIGFFMPRARVLTALTLIVAGLLANSIWPQMRAAKAVDDFSLAGQERALKVMTFNTWYDNTDFLAIGDEIARQKPDVVVLVEFGPDKDPVLHRLKSSLPYQYSCLDQDFCNMVVLSKFPFSEPEARVGWEGPPVIRVKFGPELGGLNLIGVHTIRFPHQRAQLRQIEALSRLLETWPGPQLVMGDFNATMFSRMLATFEGHTGLRRLTGYLPTWPARLKLPQIGIDQIFASQGIYRLTEPRIGDNAGSDHFPVITTVAVPVK
jgi:endonuclease/exonuclease/phosphatase (EEP) superfamily protein YafD